MSLLPQELGGAQEQPGSQLPAHDVGPLVDEKREVAVALDPLGEVRVDDGLARGPDHHRFLELLAATMGDDGQFGTESFDVLGLAPQVALGDEQREVGVGHPGRLDPAVDLGLHPLPDGVAVGADDHGPPDRPVVGQFGLGHDVLVPAGEVVCLRGENAFGHVPADATGAGAGAGNGPRPGVTGC